MIVMDDGAHRVRLAAGALRDRPAFFFDRDGTVIDDPGYLADPDGVSLVAGAAGALSAFRDAGHALVLVTNQSGIGRGYYAWEAYEAVASRLRDLLASSGVVIDAELACGHAPDGGNCGWRKPAPGMILEAARRLGLILPASLMAGDKLADIECAAAAGLPRAVHVLTGAGRSERPKVEAFSAPIRIDLLDDLSALRP
jgi:D-glycero-D-manno-heptose 1,7-bisphosphate phosphatase